LKLSRGVRRAMALLVLILVVAATQKERVKRVVYPVKYEETVMKYSEIYGVDPNLVMAIIKVESKFDSEAVSKKGAIGLMQIMPETGIWASEKVGIEGFEENDLYNYDTNIQIGTWYIGNLINEFDGDIRNAVAAYNGGSGNVRSWLNDESYSSDGINLSEIPFPETRGYVDKVIKAQGVYREIYGGQL
jgi:soluble lytic murein transglycosylase